MTLLQAFVLGLIQGLTEFLPVSSSGHLAVGQRLFGLIEPPLVFDILVHSATALAVIVVLWPELLRLNLTLIKRIILATLPAVAVGLILKPVLGVLFSSMQLVGTGFLITSVLLFLGRRFHSFATQTQVTAGRSLTIGLFQALAIIPGISRSGATISAGLITGLKPGLAYNFSFFLALPAIIGAQVLHLSDLGSIASNEFPALFIGFISAFLSGWWALVSLKKFVSQGKFIPFAVYCLIVGLILMIYN